ncbi:sigma factor-like helix-turn-helix DNA-binding protein [Marininema halotolerans]|uniref:RNA polymerase sigma-70 factor, ECF subfamily n=1 Tax=Marininema halotolerans TaxID=1155944 RepID=A0A1I6SGF1_9BACL|nr:sigma factor-like helix-turn-helix DNA-binding protein [Marininema halotolerans]SFS75818.1 RNA polymerase sigma-70 factor, ECF subfamily [Marininema halotolerans]
MKQFLAEYRTSLTQVQKIRARLTAKGRTKDEADIKTLKRMENDLRWVISWIEHGREPGHRRGMENRSTTQREVLWDQLSEKRQREIEWMESQRKAPSSQENVWLEHMLQSLSKSEYEAFVAVRGEGLSFGQTASLLQCSKSSVQSYVQRAEEKLRRHLCEYGRDRSGSNGTPTRVIHPVFQGKKRSPGKKLS